MDDKVYETLDHIAHGLGDMDIATEQIGMILERGSRDVTGKDAFYELILPPYMLTLHLTENDQRDVVDYLRDLVRGGNRTHGIIWAMGKASPYVAIAPLLDLIQNYSATFDAVTAHHSIVALDNCLLVTDNGRLDPELARQLDERDPLTFLREAATSDDQNVADPARRVLTKLEHYAHEGDWRPRE